METYKKFKEELSVYENSSKIKIRFVILIHKIVRMFNTKTFDFIVSLALMITIPTLFTDFTLNLLLVCVLIHLLYWKILYSVLAKNYETDDYRLLTIRIEILKNILAKK